MKILALINIATSLVPSVFKRTELAVKILSFAGGKMGEFKKLKQASNKSEKIAIAMALTGALMEFKKQNQKEFDEFCELIAELASKYKNDKSLQDSILEAFEE